jgi:hypothetical protein
VRWSARGVGSVNNCPVGDTLPGCRDVSLALPRVRGRPNGPKENLLVMPPIGINAPFKKGAGRKPAA